MLTASPIEVPFYAPKKLMIDQRCSNKDVFAIDELLKL